MKVKVIGTALVIVGCAVAILFVCNQPYPNVVHAQGVKRYQIIDENNGDKIERELNNAVRSDPTCRPILTIAPNESGKAKVILECGA